MAALRVLAAKKSETHRRCFVGREMEAITLHASAAMKARGRTSALTENFLPVEIMGKLEANRLVRLRVTGLTADATLEATVAEAEPVQYGATAISVNAKSVPLKSSSSPVSLASA
jgi:tRNA A37 methylthiotransferase MiaB